MRHRKHIRRRYVGAGIVLFAGVVIGLSVVPDFGNEANGGLPPAALNHIATKNERAAAEAAAQLRARSEASAAAADSLLAAREAAGPGARPGQ
jgi:hypothetical protein